jgi:diacylglycerol diphosphate phosphatase/phosphatidate phosphatase
VSGKKKLTGPHRWKDRLWETNCGFLGLVLSQALAFVITTALKNACGRPRPDFIERCNPNTTHDPTPFGLSNSTICQGDPALLKDGFRSWPSGHSSSAFAGLIYLALWIGGKLHVMDNRGEVWKTILVMIPALAATLVAVSRIMDARHHAFDVITGAALGTLCAFISYRQYFPPITEAWKKGRAYPIRTWATEPPPPAVRAAQFAKYDGNDEARESTAALRNPDEERIDVSHPGDSSVRTQSPAVYPPATNPFVYGRRPHDDDGNWSSSSEDVAEGYEMRTGYEQTRDPDLRGGQLPTYEVDTAYHRRPPSSLQADAPLDVPPEAMTAHDERGRSLTEMHHH